MNVVEALASGPRTLQELQDATSLSTAHVVVQLNDARAVLGDDGRWALPNVVPLDAVRSMLRQTPVPQGTVLKWTYHERVYVAVYAGRKWWTTGVHRVVSTAEMVEWLADSTSAEVAVSWEAL